MSWVDSCVVIVLVVTYSYSVLLLFCDIQIRLIIGSLFTSKRHAAGPVTCTRAQARPTHCSISANFIYFLGNLRFFLLKNRSFQEVSHVTLRTPLLQSLILRDRCVSYLLLQQSASIPESSWAQLVNLLIATLPHVRTVLERRVSPEAYNAIGTPDKLWAHADG